MSFINRGVFRSPLLEGGAEPEKKQPEVLELEIEGRKVEIKLSQEVENWLKEKEIETEDDRIKFFRDLLTNNPESRFKDIIYEFRFRKMFFVEITEKDGDLLVNIEQNPFEVKQIILEGITRRDFLKVLAGLGLGLAAGIYGLLRSLGFGKGVETPTPTSTPTSTLT
ncbi:MAG: twin-arginine translocation signal domain-containing protein, partial [Minisyncoccia bacterium]